MKVIASEFAEKYAGVRCHILTNEIGMTPLSEINVSFSGIIAGYNDVFDQILIKLDNNDDIEGHNGGGSFTLLNGCENLYNESSMWWIEMDSIIKLDIASKNEIEQLIKALEL